MSEATRKPADARPSPAPEPAAPIGPAPEPRADVTAAVLSYLVPGAGQVYQGRTFKGVLFLVCLYSLFFYGLAMGQGRNVFLPDTALQHPERKANGVLTRAAVDLFSRPHFAGQFFVGVAAWPAVYQYLAYDPADQSGPVFGDYMRTPPEHLLNQLHREQSKRWDLGWVYTVIAGVLNILVIYDAFAGPAFRTPPDEKRSGGEEQAGGESENGDGAGEKP